MSIVPPESESNSPDDLLVTDEYFDYLQSHALRPAQPDEVLVKFFRKMRGSVEHRWDD